MVQYLKATGQYENTLIIFMGDNGLLEGEHGMVDKRTGHEPCMRVPLIARGPKLAPGRTIQEQVLTIDIAPSILDICGAKPLESIQGRSWRRLTEGGDPTWRKAWFYEYNYEKQFPYTPNVRALRTDRYKFIRYPHGDGSADRHMPELYDLVADPQELHNLASDAQHAELRRQLEQQLSKVMADAGLTTATDRMPLDEGIQTKLPDQKIR